MMGLLLAVVVAVWLLAGIVLQLLDRESTLGGVMVLGALIAVVGTQGPGRWRWAVLVGALAMAAVGLVGSFRRVPAVAGRCRRRLRWLAWAILASTLVVLVDVVVRVLQGGPVGGWRALAVASVAIPLALLVAESPRVCDRVDSLLVRTIDLAGLFVLVATVGLVVLSGLNRVPTAADRRTVAMVMVAALVVGLTYVPFRARLSRFGARLVYGSSEAPDHVLRTLSNHLSRAVPLEELLIHVAELLRAKLSLESAEIWTGDHGELHRVVSVPHAGPASLHLRGEEEAALAAAGCLGTAWTRVWLPQLLNGQPDGVLGLVPLRHAGSLLGLVVARRAATTGAFREEEEGVLADLGRQLGLALHNLELDSALQASLQELRRRADELQASRARIVAASDAARRQIERNLHDGAQQHLIALIATLRLALQTAANDRPAANELLEEVGRGLQSAVQELRTLAHGIYPPLLVERGLGEALAAAARTSPIPTRVDVDDIGRYPLDVEAAVYFCCLEAMQNATKHAGPGAAATIHVRREGDDLLFDVVDDGRGFDPSAVGVSGTGFLNMTDRVGAIGGRLVVDSSPSRGTRVAGRVPVAPSSAGDRPTPGARPGTAGRP